MKKRLRLRNREPKWLEEIYFSNIRPKLYERYANCYQYGVRTGRTLAEHLDSACQFILTLTKNAGVSEQERRVILAATIVHDLNKLDPKRRKLKDLARDRNFVRSQLELAGVNDFVSSDEDFELVRRLIERHSGHNVSDGMRFFPEDEKIERYAAMLTAADLFDLGIPESERFAKVEKELTVAFDRPCNLYRVSVSSDKGYITSLLLGACEDVLVDARGLSRLAIFPDGEVFEGEVLPEGDLIREIAISWQNKIEGVFASNIPSLVNPETSGIKVDSKAIEQDLDETLICVQALLEKKKAKFANRTEVKKIQKSIKKHSDKAGKEALELAANLGLNPVTNGEEFAISEGIKAAYISYQKALGKNQNEKAWELLGKQVGLSPEQLEALKSFDILYGRCLFAAKAARKGREGIINALQESFQMRLKDKSENSELEVSEEIIDAVERTLNLPLKRNWQGIEELEAYINANPKKRCSLESTSKEIKELKKNNMPPGTKVQSFSNRLPGGMSDEPKRRGNWIASLGYKLISVGANLPKKSEQNPLYSHFSLPQGSSPELLIIWREFLVDTAATNGEGGTVTIDELKLYRDNILEFKPHKVVGCSLPKRPNYIHSTVVIPIYWGDTNASIALLKSLRLALELSLALEFGFPFVVSGNLEVETQTEFYGRVEGIHSTLQPLLGNGQYNRQEAEEVLLRLRCIGSLAVSIASLNKKDDCLYDLARAASRPISFYYVIFRWILREQDDPNWEYYWKKISQPLTTLLENIMSNDNDRLTLYLKEAALVAAEAKLWGSSFKRTARIEPFTEFISAVRSRKPHMGWETVFGALIQNYHTRLDRIREHGVGATKKEQLKKYYEVLRKLFQEVYQDRAEKLIDDRKTLEAAYLFFLEEARQQLKHDSEQDSTETSKFTKPRR